MNTEIIEKQKEYIEKVRKINENKNLKSSIHRNPKNMK